MSKFTKFFTICTALTATFFANNLITTPAQAAPQVLQVGIENGYYPYEYLNDKGEFTGLDVELINYVCQQMNVKCELQRGAFEALIPNLLFKKTDIVISALSITEERKKRVAFSTSYVDAKPAVYVINRANQSKAVKDLKVIGVQQGTTLLSYLNTLDGITIRQYPSFDTAMLDLGAGRLDAIFESLDVSAKYLEQERAKYSIAGEPVYSTIISNGTGIAVRKSDTKLLAQINQALAKAKETGFLQQLLTKYNLNMDVDAFVQKVRANLK